MLKRENLRKNFLRVKQMADQNLGRWQLHVVEIMIIGGLICWITKLLGSEADIKPLKQTSNHGQNQSKGQS